MNPFAKRRWKVDRLAVCLVAVLLLINLPLFLNIVVPRHDTLAIFKIFYFYYNELFFNGEFPGWLPYGSYGIQGDLYQVNIFSTGFYLASVIGLAIGIKDALLVFSTGLFIEQLVLLYGTYLLARRLFTHRATVFIVPLTVICSTFLLSQLQFNFKVYNYLPLVIFLIVYFFEEKKLYALASAIFVFALSLAGSVAYIVPIQAMTLLVIFLTLAAANAGNARAYISPGKRDLVASIAILTLAAAVAALYIHANLNVMEHTKGFSSGRDPETLAVSLEEFLGYASFNIGFSKFIGLVNLTKLILINDVTVHTGLLSLGFAAYALIFVRKAALYAFLGVVTLLTLLSLGPMTPVAEFLYYYFPMMKYFRHIGHTVGNFKLFIPLMAGFGLDHLISRFDASELKATGARLTKHLRLAHFTLALIVLCGTFVYLSGAGVSPGPLLATLLVTALLLLCLFFALKKKAPLQRISLLLISCSLFQMLSYQAAATGIIKDKFRELGFDGVEVRRYGFQEKRTNALPDEVSKEKIYLVAKGRVKYTFSYNFLGWDPCGSVFRVDVLNSYVAEYLRLRGVRVVPMVPATMGSRLEFPSDAGLMRSLACYSPKLKLSSSAIFSGSRGETEALVEQLDGTEGHIVISEASEQASRQGATTEPSGGNRGLITVTGFKANGLEADVRVDAPGGAWLSYTDAWHPGWKATVNGRPTEVLRANMAFKAVRLESGENKVRLRFDNRQGRIRLNIIALLCLLSGLAFFVVTALITFSEERRP